MPFGSDTHSEREHSFEIIQRYAHRNSSSLPDRACQRRAERQKSDGETHC